MSTRRPAFGVALVAFAVVALLFWWFGAHRAPPPAPQGDTGPSVETATARFDEIDVTVDAVGRLGAAAGSQTKLAFVTPGRIGNVYVHVGDRVSSGEALASLDTASLALAANQANADARAAAAQAQAASVDRTSTKIDVDRRALQRETDLYNAGVAARKDIEAARAQLAADQADRSANAATANAAVAQASSAQARAASAAHDVANATLTAPEDAVVAEVYHVAGESVDPSTTVLALAPSSTWSATLQVNGADALRVRRGNPVQMHVQGGATIEGTVAGVAASVDAVTQQSQVRVTANVPASLSGAAVQATIVVGRDRGVVIPHDAVVTDPATGKSLAFVLAKDKDGNATFTQRDVRVVFENDTRAEVTGVRPGERVAARGTFELLAPSGGGG